MTFKSEDILPLLVTLALGFGMAWALARPI